jgi:hypothetical protein
VQLRKQLKEGVWRKGLAFVQCCGALEYEVHKGGRTPNALRQASRHETETQSCFIRDWSASWLRSMRGGFHNLVRLNCAPFFASCRRHRVLTVTCFEACRCAKLKENNK